MRKRRHPPLPRFSTIALDPPWPERGGGKIKRGADKHYPVVPVKRIPALVQTSGVFRPADDCHMYMWTTGTHLMKAGWVIDQLGFRYVTCVPWVKSDPRAGLGQYFRGKAEYLLFAVRGDGYAVRTAARNIEGLIMAARGRHSEKPEEAFELIERRSHGPFLEMFSRVDSDRPGWTHWGNEVGSQRVQDSATLAPRQPNGD